MCSVCFFFENACFLALPVLTMPKLKAQTFKALKSYVFTTSFSSVRFNQESLVMVPLVCPLMKFDQNVFESKNIKGISHFDTNNKVMKSVQHYEIT